MSQNGLVWKPFLVCVYLCRTRSFERPCHWKTMSMENPASEKPWLWKPLTRKTNPSTGNHVDGKPGHWKILAWKTLSLEKYFVGKPCRWKPFHWKKTHGLWNHGVGKICIIGKPCQWKASSLAKSVVLGNLVSREAYILGRTAFQLLQVKQALSRSRVYLTEVWAHLTNTPTLIL